MFYPEHMELPPLSPAERARAEYLMRRLARVFPRQAIIDAQQWLDETDSANARPAPS